MSEPVPQNTDEDLDVIEALRGVVADLRALGTSHASGPLSLSDIYSPYTRGTAHVGAGVVENVLLRYRPSPPPDGVRVHTHACAICMTGVREAHKPVLLPVVPQLYHRLQIPETGVFRRSARHMRHFRSSIEGSYIPIEEMTPRSNQIFGLDPTDLLPATMGDLEDVLGVGAGSRGGGTLGVVAHCLTNVCALPDVNFSSPGEDHASNLQRLSQLKEKIASPEAYAISSYDRLTNQITQEPRIAWDPLLGYTEQLDGSAAFHRWMATPLHSFSATIRSVRSVLHQRIRSAMFYHMSHSSLTLTRASLEMLLDDTTTRSGPYYYKNLADVDVSIHKPMITTSTYSALLRADRASPELRDTVGYLVIPTKTIYGSMIYALRLQLLPH